MSAVRIVTRVQRLARTAAPDDPGLPVAPRLTLDEAARVQLCDPDELLELLRRHPGLRPADYHDAQDRPLMTPGEVRAVGTHLQRQADARQRARPPLAPMQVIVFASGQGGTGKSGVAMHLACYLALRGFNLLLLGLDPYVPLRALLGGEGPSSHTLGLWLTGKHDYFGALPVETMWPGLRLLPTDAEVGRGSPRIALGMMTRSDGGASEDAIRVALGALRGRGYDLVLIDCPTGLPLVARAALRAASALVVPMACTPAGLRNVADYLAAVGRVLAKPTPAAWPWPGGNATLDRYDFVRLVPSRLHPSDEHQATLHTSLLVDPDHLMLPAIEDGQLPQGEPITMAGIEAVMAMGQSFERMVQQVWQRP